MRYREIPHGKEKVGVIGLGTVYYHHSDLTEVERTVRTALSHGVNYFDMIVEREEAFLSYAKAWEGVPRSAYAIQMHFGAVYENGPYGWTRDLDRIKGAIQKQMQMLKIEYADMGYVHCIDEEEDFRHVMRHGLWDYMKGMKADGKIRHLGCSTHNPDILRRFLDTGLIDMAMFSVNMAYDYASDGPYAIGNRENRYRLYQECESAGVGLSVMKPFGGRRLLDERISPFHCAFTTNQCIQYALDRPAVLTVLPGVPNAEYLKRALAFLEASEEERDYAKLADVTPEKIEGTCVYCNHCLPCPKGLNIGLINKYYDLARVGDALAAQHYQNLEGKANACVACKHCEKRCPFHVKQEARMKEISQYFKEEPVQR